MIFLQGKQASQRVLFEVKYIPFGNVCSSHADGKPKTQQILSFPLCHNVLKNKAVLRPFKHGAVRFSFFITPCAQGSRAFLCVLFEGTYQMAE